MKIKYRHHSEPEKMKTYDTVEAYKKRPASLIGIEISQSEFDKAELAHFEKDKENGVILEYKVISNKSGGQVYEMPRFIEKVRCIQNHK